MIKLIRRFKDETDVMVHGEYVKRNIRDTDRAYYLGLYAGRYRVKGDVQLEPLNNGTFAVYAMVRDSYTPPESGTMRREAIAEGLTSDEGMALIESIHWFTEGLEAIGKADAELLAELAAK